MPGDFHLYFVKLGKRPDHTKILDYLRSQPTRAAAAACVWFVVCGLEDREERPTRSEAKKLDTHAW